MMEGHVPIEVGWLVGVREDIQALILLDEEVDKYCFGCDPAG